MKSDRKCCRIRTDWRQGDLGQIILAHGEIVAAECGFDRTFEGYVAKGLGEFCEDSNPANRLWLVIQRDQVKGSIFLHVCSSHEAQLRWFWLHPDLRGLGLGKRLLYLLLEEARRQALSKIYLWTVSGLEASAGLYRKAGFALTESHLKELWGRKITEQRFELELGGG